jgi:hypothetical protein
MQVEMGEEIVPSGHSLFFRVIFVNLLIAQ